LPREGRGHGAEGRSSEYAGAGKKGIAEEFSSVDHATIYIGIQTYSHSNIQTFRSWNAEIQDSKSGYQMAIF
jgi:hypothetical protein